MKENKLYKLVQSTLVDRGSNGLRAVKHKKERVCNGCSERMRVRGRRIKQVGEE